MLKGNIDLVVRDQIVGWAFRPSEPSRREVVRYTTPTGATFEAVADLYRPDLLQAGIGDGAHGFSIRLTEEGLIQPGSGRIAVEIAGGESTLTFDPAPEGPAHSIPKPAGSVLGFIDGVDGERIWGWMVSPSGDALPVITVDGKPLPRFDFPVPRSDVNAALGLSGDFGFTFQAGAFRAGARIDLHALVGHRLIHLASHQTAAPRLETSFLNQLHRARAIAAQPGAVAIACWDGAHNPIGRAKVLHDVVARRRPALLVSYLFQEFGGRIWPPLESTDTAVLTIPWAGRHPYHRAIRAAGIAFDTVWICKPRFPGFDLAGLLATPDAKLILDLDDNEEHFSRSAASQAKPYGTPTINLARRLTEAVPARTAASITLAQDFDARLLRHARESQAPAPRPDRPAGTATVGFIGTVRPHKRLLEAARAIRIFNWSTGMDVTLHVYGDVQPKSLADELTAHGVVVRQTVPMAELPGHLAQMDVILAGYPGAGRSDEEVTRYQITSKIGDALALGRAVLVPRAPSVADLDGTPGVHLFDEGSFGEALRAALTHAGPIALPEPFTVEGAYPAFEAAEAQAKTSARAREALSSLTTIGPQEKLPDPPPALLLIWKQHDAGFYGRRVDQIARSYKRAYPTHRVTILEILHDRTVEGYRKLEGNFTSEAASLLAQMPEKAAGRMDADGVAVQQLRVSRMENLPNQLEGFLLERLMLPHNTVVVLFPIIQSFDLIAERLAAYPKIMDVVDNQFAWTIEARASKITSQYHAMARLCDRIVFNSRRNMEDFAARGLLPQTVPHRFIPNWYELPADHAPSDGRHTPGGQIDMIYTGNMNDRIDWQLIGRIAALPETRKVHLVGTVNAGSRDFAAVLDHPGVLYHGPLGEQETLRLIGAMDLAVMPHKVDAVSTFMNPLKVQMYAALGLPAVSTDVPGIEPSRLLTVAPSAEAFLDAVRTLAKQKPRRQPSAGASAGAAEYLAEIKALRASL